MAKANRSKQAALLLILVCSAIGYYFGRALWVAPLQTMTGKRTVADVLASHGPAAQDRLQRYFQRAGLDYPPKQIALLAFKQENRLELWAKNTDRWQLIKTYPIQKASGGPGPKLREGDRQVPEGIYRIAGLNPNSRYHLSMKLDYPNEWDLQQAQREGRHSPGSDIFIHGKAASIGCLAMGDPAIEELFVLVAQSGIDRVKVIIAPNDLRQAPPVTALDAAPDWLPQLYKSIAAELQAFPPLHAG